MPELPDVELFKRTFDRVAAGRRIRHARVPRTRVLKKSPSTIREALTGRRIAGSRRHGKHLLAQLKGGRWLALHFGMTGFLHHYREDDEAPAHERLRLDLDDEWRLGYSCQRLLGAVDLADGPESFVADRGLGPDALVIGADEFVQRLAERSGALKSTLMNQEVLAGLGNVYTDEALFQAKLHPGSRVNRLEGERLRRLHRTMQRILKRAIQGRTDPRRMPQTWLLHHREPGRPCPRCKGQVKAITVGGRRGYHCPSCQSRPD
ncbi:MAG: DNA-formamidopyrimidine glycosylase family protein [Candidatus Krumholzibacteriia bacterium]